MGKPRSEETPSEKIAKIRDRCAAIKPMSSDVQELVEVTTELATAMSEMALITQPVSVPPPERLPADPDLLDPLPQRFLGFPQAPKSE